ncbi:hypothetical protein PR048_030983 [Dryococelus australis]|uniref:Uncharacterized protein n=1 Tax=Dryococelus australis TaxID=614101 RepID=A0ABQ9G3Z4_9NEOP|nr:hypothetical protein PR048_030983 [Dryococelus australis]
MGKSCRMMALVGGFSRNSPVSPALLFPQCSIPQSASSALRNSILRAAQISSFSWSICGLTVYSSRVLPAVFSNYTRKLRLKRQEMWEGKQAAQISVDVSLGRFL